MINFKEIIEQFKDRKKALETESDRGLVMIIQEDLNAELEKIHLNQI